MSEESREKDQKNGRKAARLRAEIKEIYDNHDKLKSAERSKISKIFDKIEDRSSNGSTDLKKINRALEKNSVGRGIAQATSKGLSAASSAGSRFLSGFLGGLAGGLKEIGKSLLSGFRVLTPVGALSLALSKALKPSTANEGEELELAQIAADKARKALEEAKSGSGSSSDDSSGDDDPRGPQFSGDDIRDQGSFPVALDLNRDGDVSLIDVEDSKAMFFANSAHHGWVAPEDGLLAIDADGSGRIDQDNEIAFVGWDERARTDLEGLALAFDSNEDGSFDAKDDRFGDFSIWQDRNSDGVQQDGELQSLADAGVTAIDVSVDLSTRVPILSTKGGNTVYRNTTIDYADGSEGIAADVAFGHAKDAATITEQLSRIVSDRAVGLANGQKRQTLHDQRETFVGGSANAA